MPSTKPRKPSQSESLDERTPLYGSSQWTRRRRQRKTKLNLEQIRDFVQKQGYKLLNETYCGIIYPLRMKCSNGHDYVTTWNNFSRGTRCLQCRMTTKEEAMNRLIDKGWKLSQDEMPKMSTRATCVCLTCEKEQRIVYRGPFTAACRNCRKIEEKNRRQIASAARALKAQQKAAAKAVRKQVEQERSNQLERERNDRRLQAKAEALANAQASNTLRRFLFNMAEAATYLRLPYDEFRRAVMEDSVIPAPTHRIGGKVRLYYKKTDLDAISEMLGKNQIINC